MCVFRCTYVCLRVFTCIYEYLRVFTSNALMFTCNYVYFACIGVVPCISRWYHMFPRLTALWRGPVAAPSPRSPGFCTWILQQPVLRPALNGREGVSKRRPGQFWRLQWESWKGVPMPRCPPPPATPGDPQGSKSDKVFGCLVEPSAKQRPCRVPRRSYTVSHTVAISLVTMLCSLES